MTERTDGVSPRTGELTAPLGPATEAEVGAGPAISRRRLVFRSRRDLLAVVPAALILFALLAGVIRPDSGPFALALVIEPHLFIAVIVLFVPVALLGRTRTLALALVVTIVAGGVLFGSDWISLPGSGALRHDISVMSWNVEFGVRTPAEQVDQLHGVTTDLVALVEVEPDAAAAIEADTTLTSRYPYRAMAPRPRAWGLALLSRYPVTVVSSTENPSCLDIHVATPHGDVHVVVAHSRPPDIDTAPPLRLPVGYDTARRDETIAVIRTHVEAAVADGDRVLLLGDFNTTPTESEYSRLTAGLRDTHVEVGEGPGWTWRPSRLTALPVAFIRIDLQLTAGAIRPASTSVDCSLPGDHCRVFGDYEID